MSIVTGNAGVPSNPAVDVQGTILYQLESSCDGEAVNGGASGRNYAMWTRLEGGAIYCLDNL